MASRKASQKAIELFAPLVPELIGGSADLTGSNLTTWSGTAALHEQAAGNYIYYGVREFGMSAMINGMALHGGLKTLWSNVSDVFGVFQKRPAYGGTHENTQYFCLHA